MEGVVLGWVSYLFVIGVNDVVVVWDGECEWLIFFIQGNYVCLVDLLVGCMVVDWDFEF